MPTLPSDQALGGMPTAQYSRPLAVVDTAPLTQGAKDLGKGVSDLGGGLVAYAKTQQTSNDALDEAKATAAYSSGRAKLDGERDDLTDPDELKGHAPKYQQNLDTAAEMIQDPRKRQLFALKYTPDVTRGALSVDTRADRLAGDQQMADFHQSVDTAIQNAPKMDEDVRKNTIDTLNNSIDKLKEDGRISAVQAQQMRRDVVEKYVTTSINALPANQRIALLSTPELSGDDTARTMQILRGREGFRSSAYWDVNHYRVGYGSDTITLPDGTVKEVKQGDAVTQADAERDLARRSASFLQGVKSDIGDDAWNKLPANARAALGSVAYNYGSLPERVVSAAKSGDAGQVADSIERLQGDNDGVNRSRRLMEANVARGGTIPGGNMAKLLPETSRIDLLNRAERESTQQARAADTASRQETATVKALMDDDQASLMHDGKPVAELTPERVGAALGPQAQETFVRRRQNAQDYHDATGEWDTATNDQIVSRAESLRPKAGEAGYSDRQTVYDAAQKHAKQVIKQRTDDPASSVDALPEVQSARASLDPQKPETIAALSKARMVAQDRIGIPAGAQMPVTKQEAVALAKPIINAPDGRETMDAIRTVLPFLDKAYGKDADKVLEYALSQAGVDAQVTKTAHALMRKLQKGEPITQTDARQLQTDQTNAAMASAAGTPGTAIRPSNESIQDLIQNPSHAQTFDAKFGPGMAKRVLDQYQKMTGVN